MRAFLGLLVSAALTPAAIAQDHTSMPNMTLPSGSPENPHAEHDMASMPGMAPADEELGSAPAPVAPVDHAADAVFGSAAMLAARDDLRRENGAFDGSMVLLELAEYQARTEGGAYRWEGEAWFGGDINRLMVKSEGEGLFARRAEAVETQLLYTRAIAPFWNLQTGVRYDIRPDPSRGYAVLGIEGIAPYWFHLTGQLFLSDKGTFLGRLEGSYDQGITQRLMLQPRAEFNFAAKDAPDIRIGSGLSNVEIGLRLRYEFHKEFAPYVGIEWVSQVGQTARYARLTGEDSSEAHFVAGFRFWF